VKGAPPEPAGVGEVRLVRTFRVAGDGALYAVHGPPRWVQGWNIAQGCACGFYAYAHPAFTRRQPTAGQVLAVVAAQGPMEVGTRGARVGQARVEAIWFGRRVSDALAERVRWQYPTVLIYRDQAAMLGDLPLTPLETFRPPRLGTGGAGSGTWRWLRCSRLRR
jgi:hypothetical protein